MAIRRWSARLHYSCQAAGRARCYRDKFDVRLLHWREIDMIEAPDGFSCLPKSFESWNLTKNYGDVRP